MTKCNDDAAHLYAHWVCVANAERRELEGMIAAERRRAARWNRITNFAASVIAAFVVVLALPILLPWAIWDNYFSVNPRCPHNRVRRGLLQTPK